MIVRVVVVVAVSLVASVSAQCSTSEAGQNLWDCPMMELKASDGPIDLYFQPYTYVGLNGFEMRTRAFAGPDLNPTIPGPVIRIESGQEVKITLNNNLEEEEASSLTNGYFQTNSTNLHLHGMHIAGERPGDDVTVHIGPKERYDYTYNIPSYHAAGVHYYHPHKHGAIAQHIGGGAAGMLIVEDNESNSPQGFLQDLPEVLLAIQQLATLQLAIWAANSGDELFSATSDAQEPFVLVNGYRNPVLSMNADQWYRFRMLHSSSDSELRATLDGCEMVLLAKDGVYLLEPRSTSFLHFSQASRVDVAVKCPANAATFNFMDSNANTPFMSIVIEDTAVTGPTTIDLAAWSWLRPKYLQDMRSATVSNKDDFTIFMDTHGRQINGQIFSGATKDKALRILQQDTIEEWSLDINTHPLHIHVNPMQLMEDVDDWNKAGDFTDTYGGSATKIRTYIGQFPGKVFLHCHVSSHADEGLAGIFWVEETAPESSSQESGVSGLSISVLTTVLVALWGSLMTM